MKISHSIADVKIRGNKSGASKETLWLKREIFSIALWTLKINTKEKMGEYFLGFCLG